MLDTTIIICGISLWCNCPIVLVIYGLFGMALSGYGLIKEKRGESWFLSRLLSQSLICSEKSRKENYTYESSDSKSETKIVEVNIPHDVSKS